MLLKMAAFEPEGKTFSLETEIKESSPLGGDAPG